MPGKFIVIEGIDGSGKTSQSSRIAQWLEMRTNQRTIITYEPGGYPSGETLRKFILTQKLTDNAEMLMFLADRCEHVKRIIQPSLQQGINVVCERWNASTLAYQPRSAEIALKVIELCGFPEPDAQILLDITPEKALQRIKLRGKASDKFEAQGILLMKTVAENYRKIAEDSGKLSVIYCENLSGEEVFERIKCVLEAKLWQSR